MAANLNQAALNWLESNLGLLVSLSAIEHNHTNQGFIGRFGAQQQRKVFIKQLNFQILSPQSIQNERHTRHWIQANDTQLTPPTLYENPVQGLIVDQFIETRGPHCTQQLASLTQLMFNLHQLKLPPSGRILSQQIHQDMQDLITALKLPQQSYQALLELAYQLDLDNPKSCICHGDLSLQNIIFAADKPYLIDWEYSRIGEPAYDLAACILINKFSRAEQTQLISYYARLSEIPAHFLNKRTQAYLQVLKPLNQLWFNYQHQLQ